MGDRPCAIAFGGGGAEVQVGHCIQQLNVVINSKMLTLDGIVNSYTDVPLCYPIVSILFHSGCLRVSTLTFVRNSIVIP